MRIPSFYRQVVGFVNCTDDFTQQPAVINGASDLFAQVFGENGRHARSAIGNSSLPWGIATEVECVVEVQQDGNAVVKTAADRAWSVDEKCKSLGLVVPKSPEPKGNYIPVTRVGNILYLCGHIPQQENGELIKGKLGEDFSIEQGYESARTCAINILGTLQRELGTLDRVKRILKVVGFVNCTGNFVDTPAVINGASDLFAQVFGDSGRHARSAIGSNALPLNIATEIECIVEVNDD